MLSQLKKWLFNKFFQKDNVRQQIFTLLKESEKDKKLDSKILTLLERSLQLMDICVEEVMVPKSHMTSIRLNEDLDEILAKVKQSSHSRYPVFDPQGQKIVGLLIAKDLLRYVGSEAHAFSLAENLRPPFHVPLSKRLHHLLTDFQRTQNHLAIVVDEHGVCCGIITIEDVLEQIVGEIEDEHDEPDDPMIYEHAQGQSYSVKGLTPVEAFNQFFHINLPENDFDTIGGWIAHYLGHLPKKGESFQVHGYHITVLRSDLRRIQLLRVSKAALSSIDLFSE